VPTTADIYASEIQVGKALKGRRDGVVLATNYEVGLRLPSEGSSGSEAIAQRTLSRR
jgi:aryl-alcohol dehydrogenase-like predicted oxidoreductase